MWPWELSIFVFDQVEREYVTGFRQTLLCGSELGALMLTHKLSKESVAVKNRSVTQPVFEGQWIPEEDKQELIIQLWWMLAILNNPYTASSFSDIDVCPGFLVLASDRESIECVSLLFGLIMKDLYYFQLAQS